MEDVSNIIVCPSCGAENIEGSDTCENCLMDLRTSDVPETAQVTSDSPLLDPIDQIRIAKAITVPITATMREAIETLTKEPSGAIVVMDGGIVAGIFTERDVLFRVAAKPELLAGTVAGGMTPDPVVLRHDDTVATALNKMGNGGYRHIPMTRDGQIEGMVTAREALKWVMERFFE